MKRCPKCNSSRVRRGYAHDPLFIRLMGYRELLCDSCNLRFRGFVIPGTLPRSTRTKGKGEKRQEPADTHQTAEHGNQKKGRTETFVRIHEFKACPSCQSENTHRSHRQGALERAASLAGIYPYRCDECGSRFLAKRRRVS
jgi:hypothetical protein